MFTKTIDVRTRGRDELVDITDQGAQAVRESGVADGVATVYVPHTTAGVTINENADPDVARDIRNHLNHLVPAGAGYAHVEGNSDAHIKSSLLGPSLVLIVSGGRPVLGTWQAIYFCEGDGPRRRKVHVAVR